MWTVDFSIAHALSTANNLLQLSSSCEQNVWATVLVPKINVFTANVISCTPLVLYGPGYNRSYKFYYCLEIKCQYVTFCLYLYLCLPSLVDNLFKSKPKNEALAIAWVHTLHVSLCHPQIDLIYSISFNLSGLNLFHHKCSVNVKLVSFKI